MNRTISRRSALASIAAIPAALALGACSDSGTETAGASKADPAASVTTETTGSTVKVPTATGSVDVAKLLAPGTLPDRQIGKDDAKVTIVEYASMTCPHCAQFHNKTLPELKTKYIDTGKARLIFREFPFDPRAEAGFMLARCSQDNYFPMVDVLYQQQEGWAGVENAKEALLQIAKLAGFTQEKFEACLTDQKLLDDIRSVRARGADEFNVDSTPTFFINGQQYKGALSIDEMSALIDPLLL